MAEFIDREETLNGLAGILDTAPMLYIGGLGLAFDYIRSTPTADVAPVVRCKDCKHGTRLVCDLAGNEGIECRHGNVTHRLDWFCADGAETDGGCEK